MIGDGAGVSARHLPRGHRPGQRMGPEAYRGTFVPLEPGLVSQTWREMGREIWGYRTWVFLELSQVTTWVLIYLSLILGQLQSK